MLNDASDYKFVNAMTVESRIHGNILPIIKPTTPFSPLYFENYLFLLEAFYERMNPESAGNHQISVPLRTLNSGNLRALELTSSAIASNGYVIRGPQIGYRNSATNYINPDTTYPPSHTIIGYNTYGIHNFLQNYQLDLPENKQPYYSMRPRYSSGSSAYTILYSDFVRAKFWTFNKMSKMLIHICLGDFATSAIQYTYNADGTVKDQYNEGLTTNVFSSMRSYKVGRHPTTQEMVEYRLTRLQPAYKLSFFHFPYATNAVLIYLGRVEAMGGSSSDNIAYVWTTKSITIQNQDLIVPSDMLENIADSVCTLSNRPLNSTISISNLYLLVDFAFPARLNNVSWNWEPTYT